MRFHAILFVRDEADIIGQSLIHNSGWCDRIYVYDTGSTDETWDIVQETARQVPQVVPVKKESVWWHDGLRAMVFEKFRRTSKNGDWWVRLDADEFYHVSPRDFVQGLAPYETAIYHAYYNFKLTVEESNRLSSEQAVREERAKPIWERRQHYVTAFDYAEPRFFRYRETMSWHPLAFAPYNAGFVARKRIPIRHYPHRDPIQMERRYRLRRAMLAEMSKMSTTYATHWNVPDWRTELIPQCDAALRVWRGPGDALPECTLTSHLEKPLTRVRQWLAHRCLLPILDRRRPAYPQDFHAEPLPETLQAQMKMASLEVSKTE